VIDTNVYISGLNFAGKPGKVLELFVSGKIEVCISDFILSELEKVLVKRFEWDNERILKALNLIKSKAIEVKPEFRLSVIKEKDTDNRILECAIEGKVRYIISGDKHHILKLKEYEGIKILAPDEFLILYYQ
jgi:putative PIN family toxin of toxin-antitoxin system